MLSGPITGAVKIETEDGFMAMIDTHCGGIGSKHDSGPTFIELTSPGPRGRNLTVIDNPV
jgi:hypothetical protein